MEFTPQNSGFSCRMFPSTDSRKDEMTPPRWEHPTPCKSRSNASDHFYFEEGPSAKAWRGSPTELAF